MEKLTPAEWKARIIADIEKKQKDREKGIKDTDSFLAEHRIKGNLKKSRIRAKCYK
jgi:predicted nucleic acid-binding protein